jgi:hypothetical protein
VINAGHGVPTGTVPLAMLPIGLAGALLGAPAVGTTVDALKP